MNLPSTAWKVQLSQDGRTTSNSFQQICVHTGRFVWVGIGRWSNLQRKTDNHTWHSFSSTCFSSKCREDPDTTCINSWLLRQISSWCWGTSSSYQSHSDTSTHNSLLAIPQTKWGHNRNPVYRPWIQTDLWIMEHYPYHIITSLSEIQRFSLADGGSCKTHH